MNFATLTQEDTATGTFTLGVLYPFALYNRYTFGIIICHGVG